MDFWKSRKFWIVVLIAGSFLAIVLSKAMSFSSDQVLEFFKWLLGITLGTHALTDMTSIFRGLQDPEEDHHHQSDDRDPMYHSKDEEETEHLPDPIELGTLPLVPPRDIKPEDL